MNKALTVISWILIAIIVAALVMNSYFAVMSVPNKGMTPVYTAIAGDIMIGACIFLLVWPSRSKQ